MNIMVGEWCVMKFLVDEMLGTLSRWLRLLGYDAAYAKDYEQKYGKQEEFESVLDESLINECFEQNRILITRDQEMTDLMTRKYKIALQQDPTLFSQFYLRKPLDIPCLHLDSTVIEDQLRQIYQVFHISLEFDSNEANCPECNSPLNKIEEKSKYRTQIPENAYLKYVDFWKCSNKSCPKIYWMGTHFTDIFKKLNEIKVSIAISDPPSL